MDSSPLRPLKTEALNEPTLPRDATPSSARSKRPASCLLPAFEPLSSSPGLPRPCKRTNTAGNNAMACDKYPTPVPTSSTNLFSSPPPAQVNSQSRHHSFENYTHRRESARGPGRAATGVARIPLQTVPNIELPANGKMISLGRSSSSSQLQLSANRLVSRVHVEARFIAGSINKIEITCCGWNGLTLHSQGRTWDLFKGDVFSSQAPYADVLLDVLDARVLIRWPRCGLTSASPAAATTAAAAETPSERSEWGNGDDDDGLAAIGVSPLRRETRITTPESPTPVGMGSGNFVTMDHDDDIESHDEDIEIYEDGATLDDTQQTETQQTVFSVSMQTEATESFSSSLSDPDDDPDEENDPIIHSFGPFGHNIAGRMASITTKSCDDEASPAARKSEGGLETIAEANAAFDTTDSGTETTSRPSSKGSAQEVTQPSAALTPAEAIIANHVVNQLAFSRLSLTPLSTILQMLPPHVHAELTNDSLRHILDATACISAVEREGNDAAGKPLETQFFYLPEKDEDEHRRASVESLRRPGLRNCRKQHKQYYWKRPRMP